MSCNQPSTIFRVSAVSLVFALQQPTVPSHRHQRKGKPNIADMLSPLVFHGLLRMTKELAPVEGPASSVKAAYVQSSKSLLQAPKASQLTALSRTCETRRISVDSDLHLRHPVCCWCSCRDQCYEERKWRVAPPICKSQSSAVA